MDFGFGLGLEDYSESPEYKLDLTLMNFGLGFDLGLGLCTWTQACQ